MYLLWQTHLNYSVEVLCFYLQMSLNKSTCDWIYIYHNQKHYSWHEFVLNKCLLIKYTIHDDLHSDFWTNHLKKHVIEHFDVNTNAHYICIDLQIKWHGKWRVLYSICISTMFNSHAMVHMYSDSNFLILHLIQKHVVPKLIQPWPAIEYTCIHSNTQ